jgi:hypothetical protein
VHELVIGAIHSVTFENGELSSLNLIFHPHLRGWLLGAWVGEGLGQRGVMRGEGGGIRHGGRLGGWVALGRRGGGRRCSSLRNSRGPACAYRRGRGSSSIPRAERRSMMGSSCSSMMGSSCSSCAHHAALARPHLAPPREGRKVQGQSRVSRRRSRRVSRGPCPSPQRRPVLAAPR